MPKKLIRIFIALLLLTPIFANASEPDGDKGGAIKGTVVDRSNKEPLIGAKVVVQGQTKGGVTDLDGHFQIEGVEAGAVTLVISYISYNTLKVEELVIRPNEITTIEVALDASTEQLQEFIVTAKANRESENLLLLEQKQSLLAVKALGAMELSRKGISNAEAAVAQISGVSKQEGVKNVFVRGLGDRYNATYLNGFPIPSDDPEYKNIALDMFETDMIQNISVQKAFSATHGGDVGGAVIDISSKELFGEKLLDISLSGGVNTSVMGNTFYRQDGTNYFGISRTQEPADGTYSAFTKLPAGTPYQFQNKLQPKPYNRPIDHGFGLSAGKLFNFSENALSLLLVANHSIDHSHTEQLNRTLAPIGGFSVDLKGPNSEITTRQMALLNATLDLRKKHQLEYNLLTIHSNNQYVAQLKGDDYVANENDGLVRMYRQQANDNLLIVNQLDTDWSLTDKLHLNLGTSLNLMRAKEPDRRLFYLSGEGQGDDTKWVTMASNTNRRFYSSLTENDYNAKAALEWSFNKESYLRLGYIGRYVDHHFTSREYNHDPVSSKSIMESNIDQFDWDRDFYNSQNLRTEANPSGFTLVQGEEFWYHSQKQIHGAYLEGTFPLLEKLMLQASLRADWVDLTVKFGQADKEKQDSQIHKFYLLPSLNLKYDLTDKQALRLSLSKSYTLPQVKEISLYQYVNIGYVSIGNPDIKPSDLWNIDLKWDYYLSPTEILTVTGFYKHLKNPMARVDRYISSGAQEYANPAPKVDLAGIELEFKKNLWQKTALLSASKHTLDLGLSGSYIWSHIPLENVEETSRNATLEGSSPWLLNTDLTYAYTKGWRHYTLAMVLSYFSDRIHTYGSRGITRGGLQYDIMEQGRANLNLVGSAKLSHQLSLKLKANNLLNSPYTRKQQPNDGSEAQVVSEYRKGVSFSVGLSYNF